MCCLWWTVWLQMKMRARVAQWWERLPPTNIMWPGFKFRRRRHMWVEFVVGSPPCSERFFSEYSGFPLSSKTNISKFQFDQESDRRRTTMWMCYLQIVIYYLFIYLFIYLWEIIWIGVLPHLSRLPHLPGVPHLHVNRPENLRFTPV